MRGLLGLLNSGAVCFLSLEDTLGDIFPPDLGALLLPVSRPPPREEVTAPDVKTWHRQSHCLLRKAGEFLKSPSYASSAERNKSRRSTMPPKRDEQSGLLMSPTLKKKNPALWTETPTELQSTTRGLLLNDQPRAIYLEDAV